MTIKSVLLGEVSGCCYQDRHIQVTWEQFWSDAATNDSYEYQRRLKPCLLGASPSR